MKRSRFLKIYSTRVALTLLLLLLIVYTLYHALWNTSGSVLTSPARQISDTAVIGGTAYLFRDETVLTVTEPGLIDPLVANGAKVGNSTALVQVWTPSGGMNSAGLPALQNRMDKLNRSIRILEDCLADEKLSLSAAGQNRSAAREDLLSVCRAMRNGEWGTISSLEDRMLTEADVYARLTGSGNAIRTALEEARAAREALVGGSPVILTVADTDRRSGYFYDRSSVDGLETVFPVSALEGLTPAGLEKLASAEPVVSDGFPVGKLIGSHRWYLAVALEGFTEGLLSEGGICEISFPDNGGKILRFTCERLISDAEERTVAVLSSEDAPNGFVWLRRQNIELRLETVTGYYIPDQALIIGTDGQTGVYIFEGSTVLFRRIGIIRIGDGYSIASRTDPDPDNPVPYLAYNDLIITSGKKLYDGKVYD